MGSILSDMSGSDAAATGATGSILEGIDTTNPCEIWPVLEKAYYQLLIGESVVRSRFGADDVTFAQAQKGELRAAMLELKAACEARLSGRPRRRAIKAGWPG